MKPSGTPLLVNLRIVAICFLAVLVTLAGLSAAPRAGLGSTQTMVAGTVVIAAIAGSLTFRQATTWSMALFLISVFLLGVLLPWLAGNQVAGGRTLLVPGVLAVGGVLLSTGIGRILPPGFLVLSPLLWVLTVVYWVSWLALALIRVSTNVKVIWSGCGFVLFIGLAASWGARLPADAEEESVRKAVELYILGLNLLLCAQGMLRPF